MKYNSDFFPRLLRRLFLAGVCVFGAGIPSSWAVLPYVVSNTTTGVLDPAHATWTGDGTVQGNLFPGTWTSAANTNKDVLVNNFTQGTLTIKPGSLYPNPRVSTGQGVSISTTFTGGTGDILVVNSTNYDDSATKYNSIGITDLQGVTQIQLTINFAQPIATRSDFTTLNLDSFPVGAALGLVSTGSTAGNPLGLTNFNVSMSYGEVYSDANDDGVFIAGVPSNAAPLISGGWVGSGTTPVYGVDGATSFSTGGFTGLINVLGAGDADFLMVRGWDVSNNGTFSAATEADLVYVSSLTWTISADPGMTFAAGTEFTISMDGQQHANLNAVPEPSAWVLSMVACAGGLILWRRRTCRAV